MIGNAIPSNLQNNFLLAAGVVGVLILIMIILIRYDGEFYEDEGDTDSAIDRLKEWRK